eukprot:TRINITY_DN19943_c0_g1_i2.p1 TRINITY_DN19943_c0_g1~~TRINITY_DN19943_c0_g1_i2.p1  ORF type:complete len:209 (+),score=30.84 TRINITY_DN19943_c0_g1_i2:41-667(+)
MIENRHQTVYFLFFFLMIRRPPRSTLSSSSAASDVYKRQVSTQSTGGVWSVAMSEDWPDTVAGLVPSADPHELHGIAAQLNPDKGEGRLRRILNDAFRSLPPHEQASGNNTSLCFVLIMMSPAGSNVFDVLGHALRASHDAGVPPGVKCPGRSLITAAHGIWCELNGALEPNPDKAACWEHWQEMSELLDQGIILLFDRMGSIRTEDF